MIRDCSTPHSFHECLMHLPGGPSNFLVENPHVAVALLQRMTGFPATRRHSQSAHSSVSPNDSQRYHDWSVIWESIAISLDASKWRNQGESSPQLNVYATANGFAALATLLQMRNRRSSVDALDTEDENMVAVLHRLWSRLEVFEYNSDTRATKYLSPKQLVACLVSVHHCHSFRFNSKQANISMVASLLYDHLCLRLCQGDAISQLGVYDLTNLFRSIATPNRSSNTESLWSSPSTQQLLVRTVRRLRKQSVRNTPTNVLSTLRTLIAALDHAQEICKTSLPEDSNETTIRQELSIMIFTLLRHVLGTCIQGNIGRVTMSRQLSLHEVGIVATAARVLIEHTQSAEKYSVNSIVLPLQEFIQAQLLPLWQRESNTISTSAMKYTSCRDLIRILSTWDYLEQVLSSSTSYRNESPADRNKLIYTLGLCLDSMMIQVTNPSTNRWVKPHDINSIVRIIAFLPEASLSTLRPYYIALGQLLLHGPFIQQCTSLELSNFAWFMAYKSKNFFRSRKQVEVIMALGSQILQPDILDTCSPQHACRILSAFTSLRESTTTAMEQPTASHPLDDLLYSLFQCLGEYLLDSSSLSSSDLSSAIYAYAKAVYTFDMGIFDHLVDEFARRVESHPNSSTLRQICQTIWSCGKMMVMESSGNGDLVEFDEADRSGRTSKRINENMPPPPYFPRFVQLVRITVQQAEQLTAPDVTQTLWAMARCGDIDNEGSRLLEPLLSRAQALSNHLNSSELACILWSICKLPISSPRDAELVYSLTRPLANPSTALKLGQPQEASIVLYALGRMNIRDVQVFHHLTQSILHHHIHTASAQTIANILWAHRTVFIDPPPQLLERWATLKLPGLVIARRNPP